MHRRVASVATKKFLPLKYEYETRKLAFNMAGEPLGDVCLRLFDLRRIDER